MPFHIRQAVPYSSEATLEQLKKKGFQGTFEFSRKKVG